MILGRIITEERLDNVESFLSVTSSTDDIFKDDKPTLIIGWKLVKKIFPPGDISILNKKITENLFWTFSKNERRVEFDKDLNDFYLFIINQVEEKISYYFFDVFNTSMTYIRGLYGVLNHKTKKTIYIHNNSFIYIFYDNKIIGVSLDDLMYYGINGEKIIKRLYKFKNVNIFFNYEFSSLTMKRLFYSNTKLLSFLCSVI